MNINIGDTVADKNKLTGDITFGTITQIEMDWEPLFKVEWSDGRIWRVKEDVALELRKDFLDSLQK